MRTEYISTLLSFRSLESKNKKTAGDSSRLGA